MLEANGRKPKKAETDGYGKLQDRKLFSSLSSCERGHMVSKIPASLEQRSVLETAQRVDISQSLPAWGKQGVVAYTDGACLNNPGGPAGWSALLWAASDVLSGEVRTGARALACFGHIPQSPTTTNNRAEMSAVLAVLSVVPPELPLTIHSDSQYTINVAQGKWQMKKNADLWKRYHDLIVRRKTAPIFHWVQGHAGHDQNVMADQLAGITARNGSAAAYERWQKSKEPDPL
jgi:ribonuclease HI